MRILCVDDEPTLRMTIQAYLQDLGHEVETVPDGASCLERIRAREFDAVLLDLTMPGMSGLEVLKVVTESWPALPAVVVSGTGSIQDVISALRLGAWDFITKPIEDLTLLTHAVAKAVERARLLKENQAHRERLESLVRERTEKLETEIAERKAVELALRASLTEKEVLLKEVHHRVKNNLQVVSSLLSLQALRFEDSSLAEPFLDSQSRVRAMALVHEKLYQSRDLSCIDFSEYLRDLTLFLLQAYIPKGLHMTPDIQCQSFTLPVDSAIPCGLVLNELITNCLKHAFPGRTSGRVEIKAWLDGGRAHLMVHDDGVGLPDGFVLEKSDSLGLQLVTNLNRQLRGQLSLESDHSGTTFHLEFPIPDRSCAAPLPAV